MCNSFAGVIAKGYSKHMRLRLGRGKDAKKHARAYIRNSRDLLVLRSAARAWAEGVPWATALDISERAIDAAAATAGVQKLPLKDALKRARAKAKAKPKPKANPKPKAKSVQKDVSTVWETQPLHRVGFSVALVYNLFLGWWMASGCD